MARRVAAMAKRRPLSRDPELIALAHDLIDPPPTNSEDYKLSVINDHGSPQATEVDKLLEHMVSSVRYCIMSPTPEVTEPRKTVLSGPLRSRSNVRFRRGRKFVVLVVGGRAAS